MRVAVVCPYSLSRPGGVQGQVLGLARALEGLGHTTMVVAPADGPVEVPGLAGAVTVVGGALAVPANGSVAPVSLSPLAARRAVGAIRGGHVDVVHLHEPLAPGPGYGCLVAGGVPLVGTFHRSGASAGYRLLGPLARWAAGRLTVRCAVSPEAEATAAAALGGRYEVVGNGVELERVAGATPWPTEGPTILFVGRHERRKGLGVLLEAFGHLDVPGAVLWIVGDGPQTAVLRAANPPTRHVQWLGRVSDAELASRLRGADVLCAPSLGGESFGMILVEAMAARTAVVASDLRGYAFVADGRAALVAPGDADALAAALRRAVIDAGRGGGLSAEEALDDAYGQAEKWSMKRLARRYADIYAAAVSGSGRVG